MTERAAKPFLTAEWRYRARSSEYQVEHPRWRVWPATTWNFDADVRSLWGESFVEPLTAAPLSAFIAEGSAVEVRKNTAA